MALILLAPLTVVEFPGGWWRYFGFLQAYETESFGGGIGPAWSLTIEVAFYAALPLYVLAATRLLGRLPCRAATRVELSVLVLLAAASVVLTTRAHESGDVVLAFSLLGSFMWFVGGMELAILSASADARPGGRFASLAARHAGKAWGLAGAVLAFTVLVLPGLPDPFPRSYSGFEWGLERAAYGLVGFLLLVPAVFGPSDRGLIRRALGRRSLIWLGLVSYGIFLWHGPVLGWWHAHAPAALVGGSQLTSGNPALVFFGLLLVTLAATIPLAAASYYLVERPFLVRKDARLSDILRRSRSVRESTPSPPGALGTEQLRRLRAAWAQRGAR